MANDEDLEELNVQPWRVRRVQTSRGFGAPMGSNQAPEALVGLHLHCEGLDRPGHFVLSPQEAEALAEALLDSARRSE
jgi:hypothetical protein